MSINFHLFLSGRFEIFKILGFPIVSHAKTSMLKVLPTGLEAGGLAAEP